MANTVPINLELELSAIKSGIDKLNAQLSTVGKEAGLWSGIGVGLEHAFEKSLEVVKEMISTAAEFLKDSFSEAIESIKVDTVLETSIRNAGAAASFTAKEIENLASIWQDKTTFDDEAIKKAASSLINLRIAGDNLLDAIKTSQDLASALGGDLASSADTLGKALANPERAVMLLRRAHLLGEESADRLADALAKVGDSAGQQRTILDELNRTYHGQAEALAKNAGAVDQLKNSWHDMQEEVGRKLVPIAQEILPAMKYEIQQIGVAIVALVESGAKWFTTWGEGLGTATTESEKFVAGIAIIEKRLSELSERAELAGRKMQNFFGIGGKGIPFVGGVFAANTREPLARETDQITAKTAVDDFRSAVAKQKEQQSQTEANLRGRVPAGPTSDSSSFLFDQKLADKARKNLDNWTPERDANLRKAQDKIAEKFAAIAEIPKKYLDEINKGREIAKKDAEKKERLDEQFNDMQTRMVELQDRANKEELAGKMEGFRFQSRIESGGDVFRRIQTAAASHDPAKGTEANTKKTADEIVKLRVDIGKVLRDRDRVARAG